MVEHVAHTRGFASWALIRRTNPTTWLPATRSRLSVVGCAIDWPWATLSECFVGDISRAEWRGDRAGVLRTRGAARLPAARWARGRGTVACGALLCRVWRSVAAAQPNYTVGVGGIAIASGEAIPERLVSTTTSGARFWLLHPDAQRAVSFEGHPRRTVLAYQRCSTTATVISGR